jgi:hypothetical protein
MPTELWTHYNAAFVFTFPAPPTPSLQHESYMEHLDTPQGFKVQFFDVFMTSSWPIDIYTCYQVIEALCSFMSEDAPSPAPSDSASKVTRRAQFRNIFCATKMSCDKLKSLIRHLMAIFEEYHDDVRAEFVFLVFSVLLTCFPVLFWRM